MKFSTWVKKGNYPHTQEAYKRFRKSKQNSPLENTFTIHYACGYPRDRREEFEVAVEDYINYVDDKLRKVIDSVGHGQGQRFYDMKRTWLRSIRVDLLWSKDPYQPREG